MTLEENVPTYAHGPATLTDLLMTSSKGNSSISSTPGQTPTCNQRYSSEYPPDLLHLRDQLRLSSCLQHYMNGLHHAFRYSYRSESGALLRPPRTSYLYELCDAPSYIILPMVQISDESYALDDRPAR